MDGLDAATFQCNHPATVTSSFGEVCCKWGCYGMLPVFLVDALSACFIVWWCLFSGGWGPLPIPGVRLPYERIRIDPLVGTLLGHERHVGPQQCELVRCLLNVPDHQAGYFRHSEMSREEQGNKMYAVTIFPCARSAKALFWMKQEFKRELTADPGADYEGRRVKPDQTICLWLTNLVEFVG